MWDELKNLVKVYLLPNKSQLYFKQAEDTARAANSFVKYTESSECLLDHESVADAIEDPEKFLHNFLRGTK